MTSSSASKRWSLSELAERLGARREGGDPACTVSGFSTLAAAGRDDLSFVADPKRLDEAAASSAGAFLVPDGLKIEGRACLHVKQIWAAVADVIALMFPQPRLVEGIDPSARIHPTAKLGKDVAVGAFAEIGPEAVLGDRVTVGGQCFIGRGAEIGDDTLIHPRCTLLHRVRIGRRCILHPGVVIGADGFKFELVDRGFLKIPQVGIVVIEDDVEIGANTCIDRAFLAETRVGAGTKIDNLVHIAHNVKIGRNCLIIAQVGIAGSSEIGDNCVLAGQVGVRDNIKLGRGVQVGAQSGLKDDVPDGQIIFGTPAIDIKEWARMYAALRRLPDSMKELKAELKGLKTMLDDKSSR